MRSTPRMCSIEAVLYACTLLGIHVGEYIAKTFQLILLYGTYYNARIEIRGAQV